MEQQNRKKVIAVDMDNTLTEYHNFETYLDHTPRYWMGIYKDLKPVKKIVDYVNKLAADDNNIVYIYTARDDVYETVTIQWLKKYKVNYEHVIMKKPFFDLLIDDRTIRPEEL